MSFVYKILSIFKSDNADFNALTPEIKELMAFRKDLMSLQEVDRYVARSEYAYLRENYFNTYTFFENAKRANTLAYYCKQNALEGEYVNKFLAEFEDVCIKEESSILAEHNEQYIQRHLGAYVWLSVHYLEDKGQHRTCYRECNRYSKKQRGQRLYRMDGGLGVGSKGISDELYAG